MLFARLRRFYWIEYFWGSLRGWFNFVFQLIDDCDFFVVAGLSMLFFHFNDGVKS